MNIASSTSFLEESCANIQIVFNPFWRLSGLICIRCLFFPFFSSCAPRSSEGQNDTGLQRLCRLKVGVENEVPFRGACHVRGNWGLICACACGAGGKNHVTEKNKTSFGAVLVELKKKKRSCDHGQRALAFAGNVTQFENDLNPAPVPS